MIIHTLKYCLLWVAGQRERTKTTLWWQNHLPEETLLLVVSQIFSGELLLCSKGKGHPITCLCRHRMEAKLSGYLQERFGTHCAGGWVGCQAWSVPPPGFSPWTIQPIASHSTNCAVPATCYTIFGRK